LAADPTRNADGTWKPGVAPNPVGTNQYTYRRNFERSIDRMLNGEISPELLDLVPETVQRMIQDGADLTTGEVIALCQIVRTLEGDEKATAESLARIWPKTDKHEVTGADGRALEISRESSVEELTGRLARIGARSGGTADDPEPKPNGSGGHLQ
jgi:hypothetical protein